MPTSLIESVTVEGFRGRERPVKLALDPGVNFLIGRNGTGKTTLINIINAILSGDARLLYAAPFRSVTIRLRTKGSSRRPIITATKSAESDLVAITIKTAVTATAERFEVPRPSDRSAHTIRFAGGWSSVEQSESPLAPLRRRLRTEVATSWLSIHRTTLQISDFTGEAETPIDKKSSQVANDFGKYFATLDRAAAEATDTLQQSFFLSLLHADRDNFGDALGLDLDSEKQALRSIFTQLKLRPNKFTSRLDNHFKSALSAIDKMKTKDSIDLTDLLTLTDTIRLHKIVQEWDKVQERHAEIYRPKDDFVKILSELFYGKSLSISNSNQPVISLADGTTINIPDLSSGEKQLFILLGETLLQRRSPCVFLADEPELSLHVDWQVSLVSNLRKINPNAQVLFATHSPDIVGPFPERAIDMEALLQ